MIWSVAHVGKTINSSEFHRIHLRRVGTPAGRVILFSTIPTTIPDTTPTISPHAAHTNTTEIPTISPTTPISPDYIPASPDYSPTPDTEFDPFEDPPSNYIPPLLAILPFLSSTDDTTDSDTPDTPPSPTHVYMMTARKRVGPLLVQQLDVGYHVDHSSSDYFSLDDSTRDSPLNSSSKASSNFHSDDSSDSSSRHSLSDHSSPDLPSTSAGSSRKRRKSLMTSLPVLSPVFGALSPVCADLVPSPKRVDPRDTSLRDDVIVRSSDEPHLEQDTDPEIQAEIDECIAYADALRDIRIDDRVVVEAVDQEESKTGTRGTVEVRVEMVMHPAMPEDTTKLAQEERAVECTEVEELVTRRVAKEMEDRKAAMNLEPLNENEDEQEEQLSRVHSTFHVLNLKKCLANEPLAIPLDEIQIDEKLHFIEEPVEIMDREVNRLKQSRISIVKVPWNSRRGLEFTLEREDQMQKKYPHLFANPEPSSNATS
nr:putative reverse transcriptase domain-containing protein [Tanacetum cinerariifolium]